MGGAPPDPQALHFNLLSFRFARVPEEGQSFCMHDSCCRSVFCVVSVHFRNWRHWGPGDLG